MSGPGDATISTAIENPVVKSALSAISQDSPIHKFVSGSRTAATEFSPEQKAILLSIVASSHTFVVPGGEMLIPVPVRSASQLRRCATTYRLKNAVAHLLRQTGHADLQNLQITQSQGCVRLSGTVRSYFAKQLAQVVAASVTGVKLVRNEIHVT
jgi:hypothetical protein